MRQTKPDGIRLAAMRRTLALVLIAALVAGACSSGSSDQNASQQSAVTTAPTTSAAPSTAPVPATVTTTVAAPPVHPTVPTPEVSDIPALLALDRPTVMAHAGGDQSWPHSTMYGYYQSALAGADVLEMDVQLTGDGVLVVQHNDTVDQATSGTGRVRDMSYDEIQALDKAYWASNQWPSHDLADADYTYRGIRTGDVPPPAGFTPDDFRIETWRNIAETFPGHPLDIEIKIPDGDNGEPDVVFAIEGAKELAKEIAELGRTDSVIVTSFNDDVMAAFREAAPDVATSPGLSAMYGWITGTADLQASDLVLQLPPSFQGLTIITPAVIAKAHDAGLQIWEWANGATQENADFYSLMIAMGVDGIIAGRPAVAVERFAADAANPPTDNFTILVTNDDGVEAPGIDALVEGLRSLPTTNVIVVAPADNQSGTSDKQSADPPGWEYSLTASGYPAVAVLGFPADSVIAALDTLGWEPDLVISGINEGQNIGPLVEISGTIGAARTAARAGYPALAASQGIGDPVDFESGVQRVLDWVEAFRADPAMQGEPSVANLNIPTCNTGEIHGLAMVDVALDPAGRNAFETDCTGEPSSEYSDDIGAFIHGWATLSAVGF